MSLRNAFIVYLVILHLVAIAAFAWLLWEDPLWLLLVEAISLISCITAIALLVRFYRPLRLMLKSADYLRESDFSTQLTPTGNREMDALLDVYNTMLRTLRSERRRHQEQYYFLDKIFTASPAGILTLDSNNNIETINTAAAQLLHIEPGATARPQAGTNTLFATLLQLQPNDSKLLTYHSRLLRCQRSDFLQQGAPRTLFIIVELTEELRRREKAAYEQLIRLFAHEVNNTVGAVNSLLGSLQHYQHQLQATDKHDYSTALEVAVTRNRHLAEFMKHYAQVVKIPPPKKRLCSLTELLHRTAALYEAESDKRAITWHWELPANDLMIVMDAVQIEQVYINIFKNALEAIEHQGSITIRHTIHNKRATVIVEDTGPGIPEDMQQQLFTPFFTTKNNGQGVGLTLVRDILSQHDFTFSLSSPHNQPTRFIITMPLA